MGVQPREPLHNDPVRVSTSRQKLHCCAAQKIRPFAAARILVMAICKAMEYVLNPEKYDSRHHAQSPKNCCMCRNIKLQLITKSRKLL